MQKMNLKKGLFGYTCESVLEYIVEIDNTYKRKMSEATNAKNALQAALERMSDELAQSRSDNEKLFDDLKQKKTETEAISAHNKSLTLEMEKLKEQNNKLYERVHELEKELENKAQIKSSKNFADTSDEDSEISDVLYEARLFAAELKRKAQREYIKTSSENLAKLELQKQKAAEYAKRIDTLCGAVKGLCATLNDELCDLKFSFEKAGRENVVDILEEKESAEKPMPTVSERIKRLLY